MIVESSAAVLMGPPDPALGGCFADFVANSFGA